ncbi:trimeric intracellular cation channel family protein [Kutzneria sp. CA-103260]|uniref:trimeric intracellular cation channel family protein n=1 Tax=Kutzneria sp. CA-103260 TaxID=2802641 RepID=UPI001BA681D6|nr:TRIC cation channel family protein [Kutzneria sp. CA-103260]QUQ68862.1 trimeric intracellular cation channel family protein [Kutzneria sp. CA-103260]
MTSISPTPLHELPAWVDVTAMAMAALFGAHAARCRHIPVFGVLLAGMVTGLGGAMARDVLLGLEPAAITTWYYIPAVLAAAIIGGSMPRRVSLSLLPFVAVQATAVGLLIGIGVQKAVEYRVPAASAILLGVIAATVGGATDDTLAGRQATIMRENHWLLSTMVFGAVVFWVVTIYAAFYLAVAVTVVVVTVLRVLSVHFGWTSPVFPGDDRHSAGS